MLITTEPISQCTDLVAVVTSLVAVLESLQHNMRSKTGVF
jgi:hypothetical protein